VIYIHKKGKKNLSKEEQKMSLQKLNKILNSLKKKTTKLYNELSQKTDGRFKIGVNGLGVIVLADLTNMETLAKGEKECQEAMEKLLEGAK
jgi:hypothetical protein